MHEGTYSPLLTTGYDRFNSRFGMHACSHPMEQMMALLSLIEGGVEPNEPYLERIIDYIGEDNLILGSDYPHIDFDLEIIDEAVGLGDRLSRSTAQKILWDNPKRYYDC